MTIDSGGHSVKPRRYDASGRRRRAEAAREAILDAAWPRFLRTGFAATTIGSIAADAQVSTDSIYKSFGGKPGLVRALCERALRGSGPVPAEARSDAMQAAQSDPRALLHALGVLSTEVAPRIGPLLLLLASAADADPEVARLRTELDAARLARMTQVATSLAVITPLRDGLTVPDAGEIMWTYSSPELFGLLVQARGWTPERYGQFVADALIAALLPPEPATPSTRAT